MTDTTTLETLILADRAAAGPVLDQALRDKHDSGDTAALLTLHNLACLFWKDDEAKVSFHLTHAYIYALEAGDEDAIRSLHVKLSALGRI